MNEKNDLAGLKRAYPEEMLKRIIQEFKSDLKNRLSSYDIAEILDDYIERYLEVLVR